MATVGIIGLGVMGGGMARNLLRAGFEVVAWNRSPQRLTAVVEAGAHPASSPVEVGRRAATVIVCVSDTDDVRQVIFGEAGLSSGMSRDGVIIDTSTIAPEASREFAGKLAAQHISYLDAPVTGGSEGARLGTLSIMVGGDEVALQRVMPVMRAIGKTITYIGASGAGQMTKLVNQVLVAGTMLAMSEALALAERAGLNLEKTLAAVSDGAAGSWTLSNRGPQVIAEDWRPGFSIELQAKDLALVLAAAHAVNSPVPGTQIAYELYRQLQRRGLGHEGNHALIKALRPPDEQASGG